MFSEPHIILELIPVLCLALTCGAIGYHFGWVSGWKSHNIYYTSFMLENESLRRHNKFLEDLTQKQQRDIADLSREGWEDRYDDWDEDNLDEPDDDEQPIFP
jgi:hypothetical protein